MDRRLAGSVLATTLVLCACSAKESATKDSAAPVAQAGAASASKASFDPATHIAVLHAKDFAFDAPDTISAGWTTFHFVNDGPALHHAQIVRLDSGKTVADVDAAFKTQGPPPRWMVFVGGPNAPDPGAETDATLNLAPGNYAFICLVDIPDHVPHAAKGMTHALTVTAASATPMAEPTSDVTVGLSDYAFTVKGALTAGKHTIKVTNNGPQPHELELVRLLPGKTAKDLAAWTESLQGPPPGNAVGGVAVAMSGMTGYATFDLTPGDYVFTCFVPDAKDGKMHSAHGMIKEFKVN